MEQFGLSFIELIEVTVYFSAITILIGIILQAALIYFRERKFSVKMLLVVLFTQLVVFGITTAIWLKWPWWIKSIYGPFLFPAIISQLLGVPLISIFFGYGILKKSK